MSLAADHTLQKKGNNESRDTAMKNFQTEAQRVKRPKNKTNKQKNPTEKQVQVSSVLSLSCI